MVLEELTSKAVVLPLGVVTPTDIVMLLRFLIVWLEHVEVDETQLRNLKRELRFYGEALDNAVDVSTVSRVRLLVETPDTTINASAIEDTAQELLNLHTDVVQLQQSIIERWMLSRVVCSSTACRICSTSSTTKCTCKNERSVRAQQKHTETREKHTDTREHMHDATDEMIIYARQKNSYGTERTTASIL